MSNKAMNIVVLCLLCISRAWAQDTTRVVPMKEITAVYEMLDSLFPHSDYVIHRQSEVAYWVNRKLPPEYDLKKGWEQIRACIDKLYAQPATGKQIYKDDAPEGVIIYASRPSFRDGEQANYVEIIFDKKHIHFCYESRKREPADSRKANDAIAEEMDALFRPYVSRKEAVPQSIVFDGPTYQYQMITFNNPQKVKQRAEGTLYDIPGCTEADWNRIFGKIKSYANTGHVEVAWNDVYRHYECAEILIDRTSTIPIVFAAAWKEGVLKLLRLEGTQDYNIILPRIWSEDDHIFDPKKNTDNPKP